MASDATPEWGWISRYPMAAAMAACGVLYLVAFFLPSGDGSSSGSDSVGGSATGRAVWIACDDRFRAYVNGRVADEGSNWNAALAIDLPVSDKVLVAVEATNFGGPGGLIATWVNSPRSPAVPAKWVCRVGKELGWQLPEFDDSNWAPPQVIGPFGVEPWGTAAGGVLRKAPWVWSQVPVGFNETIYCRWWILASEAPAEEVKPIAEETEEGSGEAAESAAAPEARRPEPPAPPTPDESKMPHVLLSADDIVRAYLDGRVVSFSNSWASPRRVAVPAESSPGAVFAVEVTNESGAGGLLGVWLGMGTAAELKPAAWLCSEAASAGWNGRDFDDSGWATPKVLAAFGAAPWGVVAGLDLPGAAWVWTRETPGSNQTIYCRWKLPAAAP